MSTTTFSPFSGSPGSIQNDTTVTSPTQPCLVPSSVTSTTARPAKPATKSKPRKRVNTAEKRHQHNAIERQRRETLNGKFLSLAGLLPSLATHRRPSKSAIVNGSINHLTHQRDQRLLAAKLLRRLCAEHDALLSEVNDWRKANGYAPKDMASAWTEEVDEVCSVEKESFGSFTNFDGEDAEDDEADSNGDKTSTSASFSGLITSRSSTDIDPMSQTQSMFVNIALPEAHPSVPSAIPTATVNGLNWSTDFAFSINNAQNTHPFAFASDSTVEQPSTASPTTSNQAAVVTSPTTAEALMFNRTPSPRSSHGVSAVEEPKLTIPTQQQPSTPSWNPAQLMYLQQQAQLQRQQQHTPSMSSFTRNVLNATQGSTTPISSNAFTQQLIASMFPPDAAAPEQIQQWRKTALGSLIPHATQPSVQSQPSMDDFRTAVRTGMGLGFGIANVWPENNHAVEGF